MSPLRLQGSTSGYSQIDAPAVAGDQSFTLPSTGGTLTTTNGGQTVQFAAGSVSAPSITTTGDLNTGIFFPAADTIAFAEGGNEILRIDSSGSVGIGTTTPVGDGTAVHIHGTTYSTLHLTNGTTGQAASDGFEIVTDGSTAGDVIIRNRETGNLIVQNAGNEAFRVDSSRRLLVGTSTATNNVRLNQSFSVVNTTANYGGASLTSYCGTSNAAFSPVLDFQRSRGASDGSMTVVASGDSLGNIVFRGSDGTNFVNAATIEALVDGTPGANDMPGRLVFSTTADGASSPTERMRITQAGKICMGNSASSQPETLQVYALDSVNGYCILANVTGTGTRTHIRFENGNGIVGAINTNGTTTSYLTSSDYRLKENIAPVQDAVVRLQQLKPCRFNFITDAEVSVDGFIAHEVQEVVPEAISGEKDAVDSEGNPKYQGIDQSKLVPLLTAALQEAIGRIESLEAEVAALKAQ